MFFSLLLLLFTIQVRNKVLIKILAHEPESLPWTHEGNCAIL